VFAGFNIITVYKDLTEKKQCLIFCIISTLLHQIINQSEYIYRVFSVDFYTKMKNTATFQQCLQK